MVGTVPFQGAGLFRFALLNGNGSQVFWRNAPDSDLDGVPDASVSLQVNRGLFSALLGDPTLANMAPVPASVFAASEVYLRTWFDDGQHGLQLLAPDQRVAAVGYAMMAATVANGAVGEAQLSPSLQSTITALSGHVGSVPLASVPVVSPDASDPALIALGYQPFMNVPAPPWVTPAVSAVTASARSGHVAVWTGAELLVWGGEVAGGVPTSTGARYRFTSDDWAGITPFAAPPARVNARAVWTGTEMILWGGYSGGAYLDNGGRYVPSPQSWQSLARPSIAGRDSHVMEWTGSKVIVWGGRNVTGLLADGAAFDPANAANPWVTLTVPNPPQARFGAVSAWTGSRLLVWGGEGASGVLGDGAQLIFNAGVPQSWSPISTLNAPAPRKGHSAVWTGSRFIVWGGAGASGNLLSDGGSYDPVANSWQPIASSSVPTPRRDHAAVWTGTEMLILGGADLVGATTSGFAFDPLKGTWRSLSLAGSPSARSQSSAFWTGSEVLVFGGRSGASYLSALQRLVPQPPWYFYRKP